MSFSWVSQVLAFIVAIGVLVAVHEFGHFWVARRLGFKVLRFSIGMGKPAWRRVGADGTEYVVARWPIGGYVKMLDEREGPVAPEELSRSFTRRPHWQRIAVLLAGPAFNVVFAILLLTGMLMVSGVTIVRPVLGDIDPASLAGRAGLKARDEVLSVNGVPTQTVRDVALDLLDAVSDTAPIRIAVRGGDGAERTAIITIADSAERRRLTEPSAAGDALGVRFYEPPIPPTVGTVTADSPAARAGLRPGDRIVAIDDHPVNSFFDMVQYVSARPAQSIMLRYQRGGTATDVRLTTLADRQAGKVIGRIGIGQTPPPLPPSMQRHVDLSLPAAFAQASSEAWSMTALQGRLFWRMLVGQVSVKNLSGPLSIAEYAGDSASAGPETFLSFLVVVSLALGFMNLLPIPILDGGQIVFQAVEWLKGSPLSERVQMVSQQLGIALLVLLMGVALFNDITRQFG